MRKVIVCCGVPASGKSTFAKKIVDENPNFCRINSDLLRLMFDNGVWSIYKAKLVSKARESLIVEALKQGRDVVVDNINGFDSFTKICKLVSTLNIDCEIKEEILYIDLKDAIERDSKRTGLDHVGEKPITSWFKNLGGESLKNRKPKFRKITSEPKSEKIVQDLTLPKCIVVDLDGTMCDLEHRKHNPYDASNCDKDGRHEHVINMCELLHKNGHKVFFFSGREDKYKEPTLKWLTENVGHEYELHMRESGNAEKDSKLKERLFRDNVLNKYFCAAWIDDRLSVCRFVYNAGLPLFRVNDPDANF